MKKSTNVLLALFMVIAVYGQNQPATNVYETIYLTPKLDAINQLNDALSAHNKKYHGPGDHTAFVQSVLTGKRTGDYVWAMGPGPFANFDSRPAEDGHDDDWSSTVMPHLQNMSQAEYWRRDDNFYAPEEYVADKIRIRFHKVKRGQNAAFVEHYAKIIQVFREKKYNRALSLYFNTFPTGNGRNMASVSSFETWAEFGKGLPVGEDFNSIHGEGSWDKWLENLRELTEWTDQEVRQRVSALDGDPGSE